MPEEVTLKDTSEWTIAGQSGQRIDTAGKLDGSQLFPIAVKLDGMLNASIRQSPTLGGTVARFDAGTVSGMPGDENGNLTGLHMRISGRSITAGIMPFVLQDGLSGKRIRSFPLADHDLSAT